ncbi:zinc finger protein 410 [Topomyia yanbarensis]|uniref:zinc finger protein 410 n=1 Tax=Topomyia yanbarensis TaxID=2498891 RepID=UPI00273BC803|nr:zinc finger protein 410 [Topomyia yanbarensis]
MNFSAFGGPFSGIHQFAAKFGSNDGAFTSTNTAAGNGAGPGGIVGGGGGVGGVPGGGGGGGGATGAPGSASIGQQDLNRYHGSNGNHFNQNSTSMVNTMSYGQNISIPYSQPQTDHGFINSMQTDQNKLKNSIKIDRDEMINQQILQNVNQSWQTLANPTNTVDYSSHLLSATLPISIQHFLKYSESIKKESNGVGSGLTSPGPLSGLIGVETNAFNVQKDLLNFKNGSNLNLALGNVAVSAAAASLGLNHQHLTHHISSHQDTSHNYGNINQLPIVSTNTTNGQTQPISQQNAINGTINGGTVPTTTTASTNGTTGATTTGGTTTTGKSKRQKKEKKRKPPKEKKPRPKPGQIRETKALDGSPLFCCPECQMAYPERGLIEQHVISHAVERRFVCDICHAALKRKDHLTRHKLSHIPDRPHICSICLKSFKRKEQLTLHIVIHTGEKKHVCIECGKGFYRKDHLRKHTRSHIARRVKSEMSAQTGSGSNNSTNANSNSALASSLMATNMQGAPVTAS